MNNIKKILISSVFKQYKYKITKNLISRPVSYFKFSTLIKNEINQEENHKAMVLLDSSMGLLRGNFENTKFKFENVLTVLSLSEKCIHDPLIKEVEDMLIKIVLVNDDKNINIYDEYGHKNKVLIFLHFRYFTNTLMNNKDFIEKIDQSISDSLTYILNNDSNENENLFCGVYEELIGLINKYNNISLPKIIKVINTYIERKFSNLQKEIQNHIVFKTIFITNSKYPLLLNINYLQIIFFIKNTLSNVNETWMMKSSMLQLYPKINYDFINRLESEESRVEAFREANDYYKKHYIQNFDKNFGEEYLCSFSNYTNYLGKDVDILKITLLKSVWNLHIFSYENQIELFFSSLKYDFENIRKCWDIEKYNDNMRSVYDVLIKKKLDSNYFNNDKSIEGEIFRSQYQSLKSAYFKLSSKHNGIINVNFKKLVTKCLNNYPYSGIDYDKEIEVIYSNFIKIIN